MHKHNIIALLALCCFVAGAAHAADKSPRIKKCQDASGRWHYGDTADDECSKSKIIEMTGKGIKTREIAAPLTEEELRQRELNKAGIEAQAKADEEQARKDKLLLSTYGHEDDISFVRDRRLADIEAQVQNSKQTLGSLQKALERLRAQAAEEQRGGKPVSEQTAKNIASNEAQIAKHEQYVQQKEQEKGTVREQATKDIERYRLLKKHQPAEAKQK